MVAVGLRVLAVETGSDRFEVLDRPVVMVALDDKTC